MAELDRIARDDNHQHQIVPIILTGDFNLQQNSEVFRLIIGEKIVPSAVFEKIKFHFGATNLLPTSMGISDECQHLDVMAKSNRYQTAVRKKNKHFILAFLS